jgi:hypothetical protein
MAKVANRGARRGARAAAPVQAAAETEQGEEEEGEEEEGEEEEGDEGEEEEGDEGDDQEPAPEPAPARAAARKSRARIAQVRPGSPPPVTEATIPLFDDPDTGDAVPARDVAKVEIRRLPDDFSGAPSKKVSSFCYMATNTVTEEEVQKRCGGGHFWAIALTHNNQWVRKITFYLDGPATNGAGVGATGAPPAAYAAQELSNGITAIPGLSPMEQRMWMIEQNARARSDAVMDKMIATLTGLLQMQLQRPDQHNSVDVINSLRGEINRLSRTNETLIKENDRFRLTNTNLILERTDIEASQAVNQGWKEQAWNIAKENAPQVLNIVELVLQGAGGPELQQQAQEMVERNRKAQQGG